MTFAFTTPRRFDRRTRGITMGQPVVHFEIGCRDSQKTQGFYSITTQFFTRKWTTYRHISTKQLHWAEKLSWLRCEFPPARLRGCRIPKETRSASGNPLPTEGKKSRHPLVRGLASAFAEASVSRRQFPYSSRTPIWNPQSRGSSGPLENARRAHATADAHGHQTITRVAPFEFTQNRRRKFRACATQRMA